MTTSVRVSKDLLVLTARENGQSFEVMTGCLVQVALVDISASTGYHWVHVPENQAPMQLREIRNELLPGTPRPGAPGVRVFLFDAVLPGRCMLRFDQYPPGTAESEKSVTFELNVVARG